VDKCNALQLNDQWYVSLIDDCKDIIVETEFTSRWALVEGYHLLGKRILQEYENFRRVRMEDKSLVESVAESLGKKSRTIYYAIQFAKEYPDLNLLPEAKNTSWHHIINKYLTDGTEKKTIKKSDLIKVIEEIKQLINIELQKELQAVNNGEVSINKSNIEFIRYLQDQINKITDKIFL
jgi:hypothetical protein